MKEPLGYDSEDKAGVGPGSGVGRVAPLHWLPWSLIVFISAHLHVPLQALIP